MKKINFEPIINVAKDAGKLLGCGVAMALPYVVKELVIREIHNKPVGYSDAVKVIMDSFMSSSQKQLAVSALKTDATGEYYKSVISVVESFMSGDDKVKTIRDLSK